MSAATGLEYHGWTGHCDGLGEGVDECSQGGLLEHTVGKGLDVIYVDP